MAAKVILTIADLGQKDQVHNLVTFKGLVLEKITDPVEYLNNKTGRTMKYFRVVMGDTTGKIQCRVYQMGLLKNSLLPGRTYKIQGVRFFFSFTIFPLIFSYGIVIQ